MAAKRGPGPCRYCGREPESGQHRVPGPSGPICARCTEDGLALATAGRHAPELDTRLALVSAKDDAPCEFCERGIRRTFLGFARPLVRVRGNADGAVICADCLDRAGDLLNKAIRG